MINHYNVKGEAPHFYEVQNPLGLTVLTDTTKNSNSEKQPKKEQK